MTPLLSRISYLLLLWLWMPPLQGQQARVTHINSDKFPQVSVTLELNGVAEAPVRDDFTVKSGDRPFPFELLLQKEPGNTQAPSREVLLILDAGPWSAGNRLLEMKKALLQLLESAPTGTAFAFGWYRPAPAAGEKLFVGSQTATTDIALLRDAIQRVYSSGDTSQSVTPALALHQAITWFAAEKAESLREIVLITPAGGLAVGDQPLEELAALLEEKQLRLHLAFYKPEREDVADQLRELAARTHGKAPKSGNVAALQTALTGILGIRDGAGKGKPLSDYAVIIRFESDEREDGSARETTIRYKGQAIPVSYQAASAAYLAEGEKSLLDRLAQPLLFAAGALLLLLLVISVIRRQQRLRRELRAERERVARAESRIQAQLAADQAARHSLAANIRVAEAQPAVPKAIPAQLVAQVDGQVYTFLLAGNVLTIGRSPDNDITLGHPTVSGRHAVLQLREGLWWVSDLDSTHGVRLNGHPTHETSLAVGDTLLIGDVPLQVVA
ncbi:MAG: FHA domain-containing protein [Bacteroidetes bacterium]|nr:FHA domain-containing protein [Bacteroidota bacterium]